MPTENTQDAETLIDIEDDAYISGSCKKDNDIVYASLRCESLVVTKEPNSFYYLIDLESCNLPALGEGWDCSSRAWKAPQL